MLLERLYYPDDFPLRISVANLVEDPLHYHTDIEFVYVLRGKIWLKNGYYTYHLRAGDVFTNAGNEVHSMWADSTDNVIAQIQVNTRDLSQYFPNLSKACYRTYAKTPTGKKHERLRELLLQLLLKYQLRDFDYKSQCRYLTVDLIRHLDKHFNLFAFDKDMVVGFDRGNPLAVERISRICTYIYQNYANNITLQNLSEMEFLSSFYLSHLIRDFTGMNFREFLCFARVEMSEVRLLGTKKKISQIAREVGFSTTAYYKKYFTKWFGCDPQAYRDRYLPQIKSDLKPAVFHELSGRDAIALIRDIDDAAQNPQQRINHVVGSVTLDLEADGQGPALATFQSDTRLVVSLEDYRALGADILSALKRLSPAGVILVENRRQTAATQTLTDLLSDAGLSVELRRNPPYRHKDFFACDSILFPIHLIRSAAQGNSPDEVYLRDSDGGLLQGQSSPITAQGAKKPSYYAYAALAAIRGDIIALSSRYCLVRMVLDGETAYVIFVYNDNDALSELCQHSTELSEVRHAINDFRDELQLGVSLALPSGTYAVMRYSLSRENNLFAHLSALDFRSNALLPRFGETMLSETPTVETYLESVRTVLSINFTLKGPAIQMAVIRPCGK